MGKEMTTIQLPKTIKTELDELKVSPKQPNYEVVEALLKYFKAKGGNKFELWDTKT